LAVFKHIFTPIKIGKMTIKNRIEAAPCVPFLAGIDGDATRELIEWERALARGGAGIVTIGDSPIIYETAARVGHILNLGTDRTISALNRLAEAIQRYGAKASIELTYFDPSQPYSPNTLTAKEIQSIIDSYAQAAFRCLNGGMDMIMIHGAHGHLISQFLSPRKNKRKDAYGGGFKDRARFATEVLEAIRDRVGDRLAIEYRISAAELVPGGLTVDEQLEFVKSIQDKIDLIHLSVGHAFEKGAGHLMIQPTYVPRGVNVHYAERFKKELKIPVTALGSIDVFMAEKIIAENRVDMVAMNRALIADHDCINKAKAGMEDTVRPCVRCNTCISRTHRFFLPVRCAVNPLAGREAEFLNPPSPARKKKVVVIGGGPAGMEAARTAAGRGHQVVLFEKEDRLGGTLKMAAAPPFKADMKQYLDWAIKMTMQSPNIKLKLSTEATIKGIKAEKPDVIVIAAGAVPVIPRIPGIDGKNVVLAGDVDTGTAETGNKVVVAGAGLTGSETALYLARQGKEVTLIDMLSLEQIDANAPYTETGMLRDMLAEHKINIMTEVKLEAVTARGAVITDKNGKKREIPYDSVVLALGVKPRAGVVAKLRDLAPGVKIIGDCAGERGNLCSATSEGFFAAIEL
jgi:2,4-dienoyl-CoA reductase-like NADH-dependent reductase (Old Yellow Enzyme family)/NADPH-dependent 2,4-dienoyl-CoA reductase/sulfur reductase-like enzyme